MFYNSPISFLVCSSLGNVLKVYNVSFPEHRAEISVFRLFMLLKLFMLFRLFSFSVFFNFLSVFLIFFSKNKTFFTFL